MSEFPSRPDLWNQPSIIEDKEFLSSRPAVVWVAENELDGGQTVLIGVWRNVADALTYLRELYPIDFQAWEDICGDYSGVGKDKHGYYCFNIQKFEVK